MANSAVGQGQTEQALPKLVEQALEEIKTGYAHLYGIDDLADRLGISKPHLIRTFSGAMGLSPGRYLTLVRVENAKLLLVHRCYSLEIVADMVGFAGANYFCKVFKKETGMTAGAYAKKNGKHLTGEKAEQLEREFYL